MDYAKRDKRIVAILLSKYPSLSSVINLSFSIMHGKAWVWVPADDYIDINLVQKKVDILKEDINSIIFSWGEYIDAEGKSNGKLTYSWNNSEEFRKRIWNECFIGMTGIMVSTEVIKTVGDFPVHLKFSEDYYWILKSTFFNNISYRYVDAVLYKKRLHTERLSSRYSSEIIKNISLIKEELQRNYTRI